VIELLESVKKKGVTKDDDSSFIQKRYPFIQLSNQNLLRTSARLKGEEPLFTELLLEGKKRRRSVEGVEAEVLHEDPEQEGSAEDANQVLSQDKVEQSSNKVLVELENPQDLTIDPHKADDTLVTDGNSISNSIEPIVEEKIPELIFDESRARNIYAAVVKRTAKYTVEDLVKMHSSIYCIIYNHSQNYNKSNLLKELEQMLK